MPDADFTNNDDEASGPRASPRSDQAAGKDSPDDLASEFMRFHFGERAESPSWASQRTARRFHPSNLFGH